MERAVMIVNSELCPLCSRTMFAQPLIVEPTALVETNSLSQVLQLVLHMVTRSMSLKATMSLRATLAKFKQVCVLCKALNVRYFIPSLFCTAFPLQVAIIAAPVVVVISIVVVVVIVIILVVCCFKKKSIKSKGLFDFL